MPASPDISALCCREGDAWRDPRFVRGRIPASSLFPLPTVLRCGRTAWRRGDCESLSGERGAFPLRCNADASAVAQAIARETFAELLDHHRLIARWHRVGAPPPCLESRLVLRACDSNALSCLNF